MGKNKIKILCPSAPSPGLILFNCEDQSDIIFIVTLNSNGIEDKKNDKWRFPAHSFIIQESSPFFQSLVKRLKDKKDSQSTELKPIVNIRCQPELFHSLMSYIYKKEVKFNCITKCLALFDSSIKFGLIDLAVICLTFLRSNLTVTNVVEILIDLHRFQSNGNNYLERLKSENCGNRSLEPSLQYHLNNLEIDLNSCVDQCYSLIDANGDNIFTSEAILSIDDSLFRSILSRDTLNLTCELVVFHFLDRWSTFQCVKNQKEVTNENKINFLGTNVYLARYLTLGLKDFQRGPYLSDLLADEDKEAIRSTLIDPSVPLPCHLRSLGMDRARCYTETAVVPQIQCSLIKTPNKSNLRALVSRKSHSPLKKLLNGLGEAIICVIQLLD